ncbi:MAG: tetratricopeptide repeat protein [Acidobacteriota bacterium]
MPLKIVKTRSWLAAVLLTAAALTCFTATWFFIKWNFINVVAANLDSRRPESMLVVDWLTEVSPSDPQTHFAAASLFEKTFEADDLIKSLNEYGLAAALSPHNYVMWLNLGKARSLSGDTEGAEAAYARALALAPNYSSVQWVYGNLLLREGKSDEGFALLAKAAVLNRDYARTAVATALQMSAGDVGQVRRMMGDSDITNATLATTLSTQKRYDEAFDSWSRLPAADRAENFGELGQTLIGELAAAKKFQLALKVAADLHSDDAEKPAFEKVSNGGFESAVKLKGAGIFEWKIDEGLEPPIGLTEAQKHSGNSSLWIAFDSFKASGFRPVSQTVAVVPAATYELEIFYRSDIKSAATLKWEIADAATGKAIASTAPMPDAGDWTPIKARFSVPSDLDGVVIRLVREGCVGSSCRMSGKISFDDISIRRL